MTYTPTDAGTDVTLAACEFTAGVALTGKGATDDEAGTFELEMTSGANKLKYERDEEAAGRSPAPSAARKWTRSRPHDRARDMTVTVETEAVIARPPADVFAALIDVESYPTWLIASGIVRVEKLQPGPLQAAPPSGSARPSPAARRSSTAG